MQVKVRFFNMAIALIGLLSGCATQQSEQPFAVPSAQTAISYHFGTPLSGARPGDVASVSFADAYEVRVSWFALERFERGNLPLLGSQARLIAARLGGQAVVPSGKLTSDAQIQWTSLPKSGQLIDATGPVRRAALGAGSAVLPRGVTVCFRAVDQAGPTDDTLNHPEPRYVEIGLALVPGASADSDNLQLGVSVQDYEEEAVEAGQYQFETAVVEKPIGEAPVAVLLVVPFEFSGPANQAVAAVITVSPAVAGPRFSDAVARCKSGLLTQAEQTAAGPAWTLGIQRAIDSLDDPSRRRAALVYLASRSNSQLCEDVVAVCDPGILAQIAWDVQAEGPAIVQSGDLDAFAWLLDRSAIMTMRLPLSKSTLPPELFEVMSAYMGEPGRHVAAVDEVMRGTNSQRELQQRLISENYIYLQDSSPAYRVRAFQWLSARQVAPPGFDPLASPLERRTALDNATTQPGETP